MINRVVIASNNQGKIVEFKKILTDKKIKIYSLKDLDINLEIEETGRTFEENAYIKAKKIYDITNMPTMADDSGLVVDYLNGMPGIMSARYAGKEASDKDRIKKLLKDMEDAKDNERNARFVCSIVFIISLVKEEEKIIKVRGECEGKIAYKPIGINGFGYDSVFEVNGKTFAQLDGETKSLISHRGKAIKELKRSLKKEGIISDY